MGVDPGNTFPSGFADPNGIIGTIKRSMALLMVLGAPTIGSRECTHVEEVN
jgi:hypothetical protein